MTTERKGPPKTRRSDPPRDEIKKERDEFIKNFFRKGAQLTEELVKEREAARSAIRSLEEENAKLRAQLASDDAIRDLLKKIEELEREKGQMLAQFREAQAESTQHQANASEIESELANLANLYVASYQLHSSFTPRGVMRHIKELLAQLVGAESFAIYLASENGELVPVASEGIADGELLPIPSGEGPIGRAFASQEASVTDADPRTGSLAQPSVCIPLRIDDKTSGVIALFRTLEQKQAFLPIDQELFKLLGAQAMSALVAARLYTDRGGEVPPLSSFRDLGI